MKCAACGKETGTTIMSMFDESVICMDCKDAERLRPDYADAEAVDLRGYAGRLRSLGMERQAESVERAAADILSKKKVIA